MPKPKSEKLEKLAAKVHRLSFFQNAKVKVYYDDDSQSYAVDFEFKLSAHGSNDKKPWMEMWAASKYLVKAEQMLKAQLAYMSIVSANKVKLGFMVPLRHA